MEKTEKNRIWIFIAYNDGVPYFSKLFSDHTELKIFSSEHSYKEKEKGIKFTSTYLDLTDKTLLKQALLNQALLRTEKRVREERDKEILEWAENKATQFISKNELLEDLKQFINKN